MAGSGEKVTRDFCLSTLRNDLSGLQDECNKHDADPDDLEFDYEALKKAWEEYLSSQMSYLSTIDTDDGLKKEGQEHNVLRNEFNATLKLAKKTIRKLKNRNEPTKEDAIEKATADIISKDKHLWDTIAHLEQQLEEI